MAASRLRFPVCSVNVQFQVHRFLLPLFYCSTQGNSSHNTCYEYFFKYLKKEETNRKCYHSLQELQLSIFEYIEGYYNSKRPHSIYLLQTKQKLSIRSRICKAVPDYFFTFFLLSFSKKSLLIATLFFVKSIIISSNSIFPISSFLLSITSIMSF